MRYAFLVLILFPSILYSQDIIDPNQTEPYLFLSSASGFDDNLFFKEPGVNTIKIFGFRTKFEKARYTVGPSLFDGKGFYSTGLLGKAEYTDEFKNKQSLSFSGAFLYQNSENEDLRLDDDVYRLESKIKYKTKIDLSLSLKIKQKWQNESNKTEEIFGAEYELVPDEFVVTGNLGVYQDPRNGLTGGIGFSWIFNDTVNINVESSQDLRENEDKWALSIGHSIIGKNNTSGYLIASVTDKGEIVMGFSTSL